MPEQNSPLDDQFANLTDRLLRGDPIDLTTLDDEEKGALSVIRALETQLANPSEARGPSPAFRAKMTKVLSDEWASQQRRSTSTSRILRRPSVTLALRAATIVVSLGVVLGALVASGAINLQGTVAPIASGMEQFVGILIVFGVVGGIAILVLLRRER